jgi:hypothetical protein
VRPDDLDNEDTDITDISDISDRRPDGPTGCPRCGGAVTGIRYYDDHRLAVCLRCNPSYRRPANGHKAATAAHRRATLARVAASPDVLPPREPTYRLPKPPHVVIVKRSTPPPPEPRSYDDLVTDPPPPLTLRQRLIARRAAERATLEAD